MQAAERPELDQTLAACGFSKIAGPEGDMTHMESIYQVGTENTLETSLRPWSEPKLQCESLDITANGGGGWGGGGNGGGWGGWGNGGGCGNGKWPSCDEGQFWCWQIGPQS